MKGSGGAEAPGAGGALTGRILAVDDEPAILGLYLDLLREAGHQVEGAADGPAAVALLRAHSFDAVVSDVDLPGLNGLELLRAVRESDLDLPVILVTGRPELDSAIRAVERGALRYLVKPVREALLLEVVQQALRLHQLARLKREALALAGAEARGVGDRAGLEARFTRALQTVWLAYQPIVRQGTGEVYGYEALVRSDEPALATPLSLLDAADRLSAVHLLGRRVREEVARALAAAPGARAFVNVHAHDLLDDALCDEAAPLSRAATRVVLEITERAALEGVAGVGERARRLKELGYRLAVDDLGAGYAGLSSFALLEPSIVKLDRSLVAGVDSTPTKQRLVRSMVLLARDLGMMLVAEGVETEAEKARLEELGCDLLQGYLLGRPARGPLPAA